MYLYSKWALQVEFVYKKEAAEAAAAAALERLVKPHRVFGLPFEMAHDVLVLKVGTAGW
jgi:hypothetical protein